MNPERCILLVEDNPDDEALTLRAFGRSRVDSRIEVVRDGEEALEYLFGTGRYASRSEHLPPRVVLLDLNLPKIDGLEVLRRMRTDPRTRALPVVVLTSSIRDRDLAASYARGANSFVRKPVDFLEFIEAARLLGVYWLDLNQASRSEG